MKWDSYFGKYDSGTQSFYMIGSPADGWPLYPIYHAVHMWTTTVKPGWSVVGLESLGDEEATGPLGEGVAVDQGVEPGAVAAVAEVGELVDDDIVQHPSGVGGEPGGDADGAVDGRARPPQRVLVGGPADARRAGQVEAVGQQPRPAADVDARCVAPALQALHHDLGPVLLFGFGQRVRDRQPENPVALAGLDGLAPASAANHLDLHAPIKAGGCDRNRGSLSAGQVELGEAVDAADLVHRAVGTD